eukprot:IDg9140t1
MGLSIQHGHGDRLYTHIHVYTMHALAAVCPSRPRQYSSYRPVQLWQNTHAAPCVRSAGCTGRASSAHRSYQCVRTSVVRDPTTWAPNVGHNRVKEDVPLPSTAGSRAPSGRVALRGFCSSHVLPIVRIDAVQIVIYVRVCICICGLLRFRAARMCRVVRVKCGMARCFLVAFSAIVGDTVEDLENHCIGRQSQKPVLECLGVCSDRRAVNVRLVSLLSWAMRRWCTYTNYCIAIPVSIDGCNIIMTDGSFKWA